ncbi:MAG: GLPGLI family protein [Bacteroidetes bacterium]|nr:GLPGLI family protein [Bacteroidota bacterium]
MKDFVLFLLFAIVFNITKIFGQEPQNYVTKVEYGISSRYQNVIDTNKIKDREINSFLLTIIESSDPTKVAFTLLYNTQESFFYSNYSMSSDNIIDPNIFVINAKNIGEVYVNNTSGEVLNFRKSYNKSFLIDYGISDESWFISDKTKIISSFNCYKATRSFKTLDSHDNIVEITVEAWFAPDINSNFGPLWFNGLPGLIIELHFGNFIYYAKKIEKVQTEFNKISKPTKGTKISQIEYLNWLKDIDKSDNEKMLEKN